MQRWLVIVVVCLWRRGYRVAEAVGKHGERSISSEQFGTAVHRSTCTLSPPSSPPREADMDRIIEEFVHQQNLRRFQTLLAETKDEPRRHLVSKLLAEEQAKDHP